MMQPRKPKSSKGKGGVADRRSVSAAAPAAPEPAAPVQSVTLALLLDQVSAREVVVASEQAAMREQLDKHRSEIEQLRRRCSERNDALFRLEQAILRFKKERKGAKHSLDQAMTNYLDEQVNLVLQEVELEYRKGLAQGEHKLSAESL